MTSDPKMEMTQGNQSAQAKAQQPIQQSQEAEKRDEAKPAPRRLAVRRPLFRT